jgi:ZIP family zinc transporter
MIGPVAEALGWGALAASSLVIGAGLALLRPWPRRTLGLLLGFGAGTLLSAVAYELVQDALDEDVGPWLALGLGVGAIAYFLGDRGIDEGSEDGSALALGALLDGIPEQLVLGISLATGGEVSVALIVAIFMSNLPEAIGSGTESLEAGRSRRDVLRLWIVVAVACVAATVVGYGALEDASAELAGTINGFAAGALLVMLVDTMIPDANRRAGDTTGLATALGFALAAAISAMS